MLIFHSCVLVLVFDWLFGEPPSALHPTVWMGRAVLGLEQLLYRQRGISARLTGTVTVLLVVLPAGIIGYLAQLGLADLIPAPWHFLAIAVVGTLPVACRSLFRHLRPVLFWLCRWHLLKARRAVSMVVGRDTENLSRTEVSRAAVETLAESFGDGIVSPLFWFALAGLPGAFIYRAVNTMDSMIGHEDEKYGHFGWAAARLDDLMNWLPGRLIALPMLALAGLLLHGSPARMLSAYADRHRHRSPNAGPLEALMAGILNVRLGGKNSYAGEADGAEVIFPAGESVHPRHIPLAMRVILLASFFSVLLLDVLQLLLLTWFLGEGIWR